MSNKFVNAMQKPHKQIKDIPMNICDIKSLILAMALLGAPEILFQN